MFDGEIVKTKFPLNKFWTLFLVHDRVQNRVQDKVGLENFHPKIFLLKALKYHV